MYNPGANSANPRNWLGLIWNVANHMVYEARGSETMAFTPMPRTLLENDLSATGTLHECYHPDSGEPKFNAGFMSWNLLGLLMETE